MINLNQKELLILKWALDGKAFDMFSNSHKVKIPCIGVPGHEHIEITLEEVGDLALKLEMQYKEVSE